MFWPSKTWLQDLWSARASPSAKSVACRATDAGQPDAALHLCGLLAHRGGWARRTDARARLRVKVDTRHMRAMRRGASLRGGAATRCKLAPRACTVARWPECAAADICDPAGSVMSGSITSLLVRQRKRSAARLLASCRTRRLRLPLPQNPDKRVLASEKALREQGPRRAEDGSAAHSGPCRGALHALRETERNGGC